MIPHQWKKKNCTKSLGIICLRGLARSIWPIMTKLNMTWPIAREETLLRIWSKIKSTPPEKSLRWSLSALSKRCRQSPGADRMRYEQTLLEGTKINTTPLQFEKPNLIWCMKGENEEETKVRQFLYPIFHCFALLICPLLFRFGRPYNYGLIYFFIFSN